MIRQYDAEQDKAHPWLPCPPVGEYCSRLADRWSLTIVNADLRHAFADRVGFVIAPLAEVDELVLCAYPGEYALAFRKYTCPDGGDVLLSHVLLASHLLAVEGQWASCASRRA